MTNTKSDKNVRLKIRLKIFRDRKKILDTTRSKRGSIQHLIRKTTGDKYSIKVTYGNGRTILSENEEICNEGVYKTKTETLRVLSIFTSKDEVNDYLQNYAK